jgi:hypothetical protein
MLLNRTICSLVVAAALFAAGGQPWKNKAPSDWTDNDAKELLTDSPWAKTVHPTMENASTGQRSRRAGIPGIGIGIPGIGIGLPGGMGRPYPGGGYPAGRGPNGAGGNHETVPVLRLRWESAQPIREAELKTRETNAPAVDEGHYAIAVYGVPDRMLNGDTKTVGDRLKKQASIRLDDINQSSPRPSRSSGAMMDRCWFTCSHARKRYHRRTDESSLQRRSRASNSRRRSMPRTCCTAANWNSDLFCSSPVFSRHSPRRVG